MQAAVEKAMATMQTAPLLQDCYERVLGKV